MASCSGDQPQSSGMFVAMQANVCPVNNCGGIYSQSGMGYSNCQNGTYSAYPQHQPLEGCMYVNEHDQMCWPYASKQLYEGLSSVFLPPDLAIYALVGGQMVNPVALSFLEQFLSQWNFAGAVIMPNESKENKTVARTDKMVLPDALSSDESCWMFEDSDGSCQGPHCLAELSYWPHSRYLQDLSMTQWSGKLLWWPSLCCSCVALQKQQRCTLLCSDGWVGFGWSTKEENKDHLGPLDGRQP